MSDTIKREVPAWFLSSLPVGSPARQFPYLAHLLSGWFNQDYSYEGENLEEIIGSYRQSASDNERAQTIADIQSFLVAHRENDAALANALEATFHPEVIIEGWDGFTSKQWLEKVAGLLA